MSDYGDYSDYGSDHEWMYVEDHYDEADDLAEHTCHSPNLNAQAELQLNADDYDPYDYWEDLAYLSDSYFDGRTTMGETHNGEKRKATLAPILRNARRRRLSGDRSSKNGNLAAQIVKCSIPDAIVVWKSNTERDNNTNEVPLAEEVHNEPVALLKDWKERFRDVKGLPCVLTSDTTMTPISGEGFDLGDLQSVAGLLSNDSINALQEMLRDKGLDPEAVQLVLEDLIAGNEPTFEDEETGDENEDENGILEESNNHTPIICVQANQPNLPPAFRPGSVEEVEGRQSVATHHESLGTNANPSLPSLEPNKTNGVNAAATYSGTNKKRKTPEDNVDLNRSQSSATGKRTRGSSRLEV